MTDIEKQNQRKEQTLKAKKKLQDGILKLNKMIFKQNQHIRMLDERLRLQTDNFDKRIALVAQNIRRKKRANEQ